MLKEAQPEHLGRQAWEIDDRTKFEKAHTVIFEDSILASQVVAQEIADLIKQKAQAGEPCVLGLATGSTPKKVYAELVRLHREEGLSFANVHTFNLDEYYPMEPIAFQSYVRFMRELLFDHVDIDMERVHIPDGTLPRGEVEGFCQKYEQMILELGGLDLQILGIGRTGHIGFNEPGSHRFSRTRMITLDEITRLDAAKDFMGRSNVPTKAVTMGVETIMNARRVVLMAWGEGKAPIIKRSVEGEISEQIPATFLQDHTNVSFVLDRAAAAELTRIKTPWAVGSVDWRETTTKSVVFSGTGGDPIYFETVDQLTKSAVIWLSQHLQKPILKLTDRDYNDNGMSDLVVDRGSAYDINIRVFNEVQHTITGWPGGKPNADDTYRPERAAPASKKALVFSPLPDDAVVSMGGTLHRLVDQGHDVYVAFQTSGAMGVSDEEALRYAEFVQDLDDALADKLTQEASVYDEVFKSLNSLTPGDPEPLVVRMVKRLIRRSEAKAACRFVGIPSAHEFFLDMPFYETGGVSLNSLGEADINQMVKILTAIKPQQIYAAGDLSDPLGVHRVCLDALIQALSAIRRSGDDWLDDCWIWLYRGAWQEWSVDDIEMAVPLSPEEVIRKRNAIFRHQSQKDTALIPDLSGSEPWRQAEQRNARTAEIYDQLGLAEYEAIEAFKRCCF